MSCDRHVNTNGLCFDCAITEIDRLRKEVKQERQRADEADALYCEIRDQREVDIAAEALKDGEGRWGVEG
jgi:hypothetical protein